MIKANELRVGNILVFDEMYEIRVEGAYSMDGREMVEWTKIIDENVCGGSPINEFKPIPLTAEWLEGCGFENDPNGSLCYRLGDVFLCDYNEKGIYGLVGYKTEVAHLHQLQNLYFALTGEELQFKM